MRFFLGLHHEICMPESISGWNLKSKSKFCYFFHIFHWFLIPSLFSVAFYHFSRVKRPKNRPNLYNFSASNLLFRLAVYLFVCFFVFFSVVKSRKRDTVFLLSNHTQYYSSLTHSQCETLTHIYARLNHSLTHIGGSRIVWRFNRSVACQYTAFCQLTTKFDTSLHS